MTDSHDTRVRLDLPGAKGSVELDGVQGIVAKLYVNGERIKPSRGGWEVPVKGGGTKRLVVRGWIPGFQSLWWDAKQVYKLGGHVGRTERIVMFSPAILIVLMWFLTPIALALFFMNIPVVKNSHMPRPLRIALPLINTAAVIVALFAIVYMASGKGQG